MKAFAFDPVSRSLLLGHDDGLSRLSQAGTLASALPLHRGVDAIGVSPFALEASLELTSPLAGSLTNNPTPALGLQLRALCSGTDCGFPGAFYGGYALSVLLNGQQFGPSFTINPVTGGASYVPTIRLLEGSNALVATATDSFGRVSNEVSATFTVDTIPPTFLTLAPDSPLVTNQSIVHVTGRVGEPAMVQVASTPVATTPDGSFARDVTVVEGGNTIGVLATDLAGNTASRSIAVTLDTVPPAFGPIAPADGSTLSTPGVTISGTVSEPSTITLGGDAVAQTVDGQSFAFAVTLQGGMNTFTLTARDRAGNQVSTTLRLALSSGLALTISGPASGSSVSGSFAYVTGTVDGPSNFGVSASGSVATVVGNRFVVAVPVVVGQNAINVIASSQDGSTASQTITVTAGLAPALELTIDPAIGIAPFDAVVKIPTIPDRLTAQTQVDFDGDGTIDASTFGFDTSITYTYTVPGIYNATIHLNDFAGGNYSWTVPVVVQDVRAIDQKLQGIITGMFAKLKARDIEGALAAFTPQAGVQYRAIFKDIGDGLPAAMDQIGQIVDGRITSTFAEYVLVRDKPSGKQAYLIYLLLGPDGVWRISQM